MNRLLPAALILLCLLAAPAAAITINGPDHPVRPGETFTLWGFADGPAVSLTISSTNLNSLGTSITSDPIRNKYPSNTIVQTGLFGYWAYTTSLDTFDPDTYTITAYDTDTTEAVPDAPIPSRGYSEKLREIQSLLTRLYNSAETAAIDIELHQP